MMDIECSIDLSDSRYYDFLKDFFECGLAPITDEKIIKFHSEMDIEFNENTKELLFILRKNRLQTRHRMN